MPCLTQWGRDKMTTIMHIISKSFLFKSLQFVSKGAVDYERKLVQAMVWQRSSTKPLPESVVIQVNGAYLRLSN